MQRRDFFRLGGLAAVAGLGSSAVNAMPCKNWELSAIHLTALGLPPAELVKQAHRAGYSAVGIRINPIAAGSVAYPFKAGSKEIREFKALLNDLGMRVHGVDGFAVNSYTDPSKFAPIFEACGELGIKSLCCCADAPDKEKFVNATFPVLPR